MNWRDGIQLQFFNTESRQKEPFVPASPPHVKLYTCGPTVYHFAHIGNFRTYVFEDLLRRTLKLLGYEVEQVMNITDVDDKTIKGAIRDNLSLADYTRKYREAFFTDLAALHIEPVEHTPAATEHIGAMIRMIETLMEKGAAYLGKDGSVYFSISKFPRYGCLSHLKLDELKSGASERVETDEYDKDHASDFVLWKAYDAARDGNIFWESPFGKGRPGWHLECSAMATEILGKTIDLHCGGVDNIFPHHENEIAQSEASSGVQFVRQWLHAEHLIVEGKKMSKSLGNFFTLRDLLAKGYTGTEVRYMLIHAHYRTQLNFTFEELDGVRQSIHRLNSFVIRLQEDHSGPGAGIDCHPVLRAFTTALADDLNISVALAVLFDFVRDVNALLDKGIVSSAEADAVLATMRTVDTILAVMDFETLKTPPEILELLEQRQQARKDRDFARADQLRDEIIGLGYVIEDTAQGARVKKGAAS